MTTANPTPGSAADLAALVAQVQHELRAGRLAEATAAYYRIIEIRPEIAEAHNDLGTLLAQQGRFDLAVARFEQAISLRPNLAMAYYNLGNVLGDLGRLSEAATRFEQAISFRPDYPEALNNLGNLLTNQGKFDQAVPRFEQALTLRPQSAELYNNLGNALSKQGKLDEAAARLEQALILQPDYAEAYVNLGNVFASQNKLDQAAARFERAIALRPDNPEAHNNLASVLWKQDKFDEATVQVEKALALWPDFAEAHNNLGNILASRDNLDLAAAQFEQALALRPDHVDFYNNLGKALLNQFQLDQAAARFEQALARAPDFADAECGLATCYLVKGDYERGWPAYEARLRLPEAPPQPNLPRWNGEPLVGRSLLLVAEQGLGDTLHFVRFAHAFKARGAKIVLACQAALRPLLASHPDLDELFILGSSKAWPHCDFYLPLHSAPFALRTSASTIPSEIPYLAADPKLTEAWRRELSAVDGFKIGIVWQGSRGYSSDRWRSIQLAHFAPLARSPGVRLFSLQKGFGSEQVAKVDFPVLDLSDRLDEATGPFLDTAAVISNLDLVVTANTAVAHLAGALGAPVWLALQFSPDWRWLRDCDDSPWYPTMRLFRQNRFGDWPDVFERITNAVRLRGRA
jgi:Flp pilus assembly protein TadD